MKKILKIAAIIFGILILAVAAGLIYITQFKPNIPVEEVKIEYTPERIERGRYLAHNVAQCIDCHSTRDWARFSGPVVPGTEGKGGEVFDRRTGYPGTYYAQNITPANLKDWTDGEILRAITAGVSRDGRPLFPVMPYPYYGKMDREDIYSIVAYIRSLPAVENSTQPSETNFPMNLIIRTIPSKPEFSQKPAAADKVKYGEYLANAAACIECHTPVNRGQIIKDLQYSGSRHFSFPDGSSVVSSNITPDKQTGIGSWDETAFVQRFKAFDKSANAAATDKVNEGEFNSQMPWTKFAQMTNEDLAAIYAYLMTQKPVQNKIQNNFIKK